MASINKIILPNSAVEYEIEDKGILVSDTDPGESSELAEGYMLAIVGEPPQPYVPPEWSTGTDEGIVEALEKHYAGDIDLTEYWAVGDERTVSLPTIYKGSSGVSENQPAQDVVFVLSHVGGKELTTPIGNFTECVFQVDQKDTLTYGGNMNVNQTNYQGWAGTPRRTWCNDNYYNAIPSTLRFIFKQHKNSYNYGNRTTNVYTCNDYFCLRAEAEVYGSASQISVTEGSQITYYVTAANRIKNGQSGPWIWWLRTPTAANTTGYVYIDTVGVEHYTNSNSEYGIAPFGVI